MEAPEHDKHGKHDSFQSVQCPIPSCIDAALQYRDNPYLLLEGCTGRLARLSRASSSLRQKGKTPVSITYRSTPHDLSHTHQELYRRTLQGLRQLLT